ncbi:MAG: hypothetical protein FK734_19865 [Asgard group archaeon]|nr:hypothetical protein [Asgard group archaeon]
MDDIAFIIIDGVGLKVLNISDPTNIIELAEYSGTTMVDVEVQNELIFLSMHQNGLMILKLESDISSELSLQAFHLICIIPIFALINKIKCKIKRRN